jgi:protein O-GlcNAc transferase
MDSPPASRNAPCPCGSGKRYKDCHGALGSTAANAATAGEPNIDVLLDRARRALASGDRAGAESVWRQVLAADPDNAESNFHLANGLREAGDSRAAIAGYERALRAAPGNSAALNNLGLALEAVGEHKRAFECYEAVLGSDPHQADALGNLASALFERDEFQASAAVYDRLTAIRRELPVPIVVRRGMALQKSGRMDEAEASFREAAKREPDDVRILANLGSACIEQTHYRDADAALTRAFDLDPANAYVLSMLAHARAHRCAWSGISDLFATLEQFIATLPQSSAWNVAPMPLLAMPLSPQVLLRAAKRWGSAFVPKRALSNPVTKLGPDRRLRVGFVSSDFRLHPMASVIPELLERLDRTRLETFGYGLVTADTGPVGTRIANAFDHFIDVSTASATQAVERIRADGIAILFDLNGYTRNARPELFALRSAPLQINSIGFPGSLGMDWYDYIHADPFVAPAWAQHQYSERFFLMPHSYYPSDTVRAPQGPPPTRAACGLPSDAFVFCSFNNAFKILPEVFAIWMRLLAATPHSVLWLLEANADVRSNLQGEAARAGIASERLIFAPRVPNNEHMARYAAADLFLDTSPYGAHTTANDALLAGLPVVTCAGETFASRVAGSQLHAIGLPELVTTSFADYEALALSLARAPRQLAALRTRLAQNRHTQPLFDMARYARDLEDGLLCIWRDYETGAEAASR